MISFPRNIRTGKMTGKMNQMSSSVSGMVIYRESKLSGVIKMFYILIEAWDTQLHEFVKTYETALFKSLHFIVHKNYLHQIFLTKTVQGRA